MELSTTILTPAHIALGLIAVLIGRTVYLSFFGPLAHFPGPWYSKFTQLRFTYANVTGNGMHYIHALHQQYGPYVRVTPSKLAVNETEAVKEVHAIPTKYPKSRWYTLTSGPSTNPASLLTLRDIKAHGKRRRLLGAQLSESALREQESLVKSKTLKAMDRMAEEQARLGYTNVAVWATALTNDTIGQLSFGVPFSTLDSESGFTDLSESVRRYSECTVWLPEFPILRHPAFAKIPFLGLPLAAARRLRFHATGAIVKYLQAKPEELGTTLFSKLDGAGLTQSQIIQEAVLYMIAGTDTTATTFSYLVWMLAQRQDLLARLREELKTVSFDNQSIKGNKFIDNLISEVLRLYSAAQCPLPREVPAGGAHWGPFHVPAGTDVLTQAWTMHRSPEAFPEPEAFKPERWEQPTKQMLDNYYPFGGGARACIGVHLARMELRLAVYAFFTRFAQKVEPAKEQRPGDMFPYSYVLTLSMGGHRCLINVA